ncbi:MAG: L-histidine N(alpha)-methyltransferase [Rhodothalassiaceae bacterium]
MPSCSSPKVSFINQAPARESFADAVLAGLSRTPRTLPAKFFYDGAGSALFDRITDLPEYYPTRTEIGILRQEAPRLAQMIGPGAQLIEFGAGSLEKVRLILSALEAPEGFTAIDISGSHLKAAAEELARDYPQVPIAALCADYTRPLSLPEPLASSSARRVGFFPGSTIGNFEPEAAVDFLATVHPVFEPRGLFIVGVDLKKDRATLEAAYNDPAGVTAAFNLNMLARINRELGGNFALERFRHHAFYNEEKGRIEMHLVSLADQVVSVAGRTFSFRKGESIHTESSYKYATEEFQALAARAGWLPAGVLTDPESLFSLHLLKTG